MIEGCSNGLDGGALKHLVTNWMVSCIISVKLLQGCSTATGSWLSKVPILAVCISLCEGIQRNRTTAELRAKDEGIVLPKKVFADWILNTVVEVTIYLMPAKLARTSGAGYLVQLFMISSKI